MNYVEGAFLSFSDIYRFISLITTVAVAKGSNNRLLDSTTCYYWLEIYPCGMMKIVSWTKSFICLNNQRSLSLSLLSRSHITLPLDLSRILSHIFCFEHLKKTIETWTSRTYFPSRHWMKKSSANEIALTLYNLCLILIVFLLYNYTQGCCTGRTSSCKLLDVRKTRVALLSLWD